MAKLTISAAAREFGVSRSTLYRAISNGTVSIQHENGVKYIDSSEMVRHYGTPRETPRDNLDVSTRLAETALETEVKHLKKQISLLERLASGQDREIEQKEKVIESQREMLTAFFKRLNPPKKTK